jgi:uncharacterized membrane protein YbhN (UPF0104 family)
MLRGPLAVSLRSLFRPRILVWLILLLLLAWGVSTLPLREAWALLVGMEAWQLAALLLFNSAIIVLFALRWWLFLRVLGHPLPLRDLALYRLAAFGVTYFTPGPQVGGEPLQVYLTRLRHPAPGSAVLASVALDKLFELQANFTFLVVGVFVMLRLGLFGGGFNLGALLLGLALLLLPAWYLLALWLGRRPAAALAGKLGGRLGRIARVAGAAEWEAGELFRRRPAALLAAGALSAVIWAAMLADYWLRLHFLGVHFDLAQATGALTAARLAYLLPVPAGVGALEASQALAMQALGVGAAAGIGASLLIRLRDLPFAALGLWLGAALAARGRASIRRESPLAGTGLRAAGTALRAEEDEASLEL